MAKIMCKCFVCGVMFDRNSIQAVKHSANRYSHATCEPDNKNLVPMENKANPQLEELKNYISQIYKDKANWKIINNQLKQFIEKGYSYSGILKTLIYFYEVKHNSIEKSNGGIGIIEYVYDEALKYYYAIWQAQQINLEQSEKSNDIVKEYIIKPPRGVRRKLNLIEFNMEGIDFEAEE